MPDTRKRSRPKGPLPGYAVRIRRNDVSVVESYFLMHEDDELVHFGIKGQKWGVRRFQNEDRTLTEAGKERYNKETRAEKKAQKKAAKPESATWKSEDAQFLDDAELNRRNSRLQREQQYRQMTESKGSKFLKSIGKNMNKILVASLVGAAAGVMGKHYRELLSAGEAFIGNVVNMPIDLANLRG